jgi:probable HAF family extracellular repeat protein
MRSALGARILACVAAVALLAAPAVTTRLAAQAPPSQESGHYRVIDLGTLGGTASSGNTINNLGWAMGSSNETGNAVQLATLWFYGLQIPLGTLGGPSSNIAWPVKNNFGLISGTTENGTHDPLNETFSCPAFGFSSGNSCVAFAWQFGQMTQLPGLGGNNSIGAGDNDLGQIVGWAENTVHDPTCQSGGGLTQVLQFEAVVWEKHKWKWQVRQLPPYPGDLDSAATAINDLGQVVGISGQCDVAIGAYSAIHAVLWQNGTPIDLGSFGGHGWNTPTAVNNRGVVVGFLNGPNDLVNGQLNFAFLAFLWSKEGGLINLHTLPPGDAMSEATDINDKGQVVGVSYLDTSFDNPRAFIYQTGRITDLNTLIGGASANFYLSSTGGINDRGEIAAQANIVSNGVVTSVLHAVLLVPTDDPDDDDTQARGDARKVTIPDSVQEQMKQRVGMNRFVVRVRPQ